MKLTIRPLARLAISIAALSLSAAASAQSSPSAYTHATRYDAAGRVTGTISPDPDGVGTGNPFLATRNSYDAAGRLVKVESGALSAWKAETDLPENWGAAFTVHTILETTYDAIGRKIKEVASGKTGSTITAVSLTQYSYDTHGRLECSAIRMNPSVWASLPTSACSLGTQGSHGPDRITRNYYDAAGQLLQVRKAVGTDIEQSYVTYGYTGNGRQKNVIDANGNKAELVYDGHDRQIAWKFPSKTLAGQVAACTLGTVSEVSGITGPSTSHGASDDCEKYWYDAGGNRARLQKRDGSLLGYTYDALDRMTVKTVPARSGLAATHTRNVYYGYDLRGLQTYARFDSTSGQGIVTAYDGFGRISSATANLDGQTRALSYLYDKNGNRTRITHPDNAYFTYDYDGLDRLNAVKNSAGNALAAPVYGTRGLLASAVRYGTAHNQSFTYDTAGRLSALGIAGGGTTAPAVSWTFTRNAASQLLTDVRDNDSYAWAGQVNVTRGYTVNGLNQYTAAGGATFCHDANGNLTADGSSVYKYDIENRLVEQRVQTNTNCGALSYTGALQTGLRYDPLGRLHETTGQAGAITRFLYDGDALVGEYDSAGTLLRRYVHGGNAAADDPLVWFEGASTAYTAARHLYADPRGSVVLVGNASGAAIAINSYDEYGIPASGNQGRFQYTGQAWLPELGMYYYKARIYSPTLGRFMQIDPIGYEDQINLYAYVANDPINLVDPTGMEKKDGKPPKNKKQLIANLVELLIEGIVWMTSPSPEDPRDQPPIEQVEPQTPPTAPEAENPEQPTKDGRPSTEGKPYGNPDSEGGRPIHVPPERPPFVPPEIKPRNEPIPPPDNDNDRDDIR